MTDICSFCEKWTAQTWEQHANRLHNMRAAPEVKPHPCPRCGGTYWASRPPSVEKNEARAWNMWSLAAIAAVLILVFAMTVLAYGETLRDASGRLVGTSTRDANGTTTIRDSAGRMTGTATRDRNGTTTFRDSSGRMTGTAERRLPR